MTESIPLSHDDAIIVLCGFSIALGNSTGPSDDAYGLLARIFAAWPDLAFLFSALFTAISTPPPAQSTR